MEERGKEEELRSLSGLEKAGVSDCRGGTQRREPGSDSNIQSSFHVFMLSCCSYSRACMCELMHIHRNTVQTATDNT